MNVIIGTNNQAKIAIVTTVLNELYPSKPHTITGEDVASGVPDTPRDEETKQGAFNRASTAAALSPNTYGIGIESGLVQRYGMWFEEAWACVVVGEKTVYGYSSGLPVPPYVLQKMKENNLEHGPAMHHILAELNRPDERDTWGTYSDKLILRDVSLQEALRNALIQMISSDNSLYKL
jgi:inosine/xanthosine triphosphatase